jgi:hypothetical protein
MDVIGNNSYREEQQPSSARRVQTKRNFFPFKPLSFLVSNQVIPPRRRSGQANHMANVLTVAVNLDVDDDMSEITELELSGTDGLSQASPTIS